jgi:LDH2 family malate/lactate/ureidoglycolate dehydrogenase
LYPGEIEQRTNRRRSEVGVPVTKDVLDLASQTLTKLGCRKI